MSKAFVKWLLALLGIILGITLWLVYVAFFSNTRIALVNYPEFRMARMQKALDTEAIELSPLALTQLQHATDYDVVMIFGRGLNLSSAQKALLEESARQGTRIVVESATDPASDISRMAVEHLEKIKAYLRHGGTHNYQQLFRYIRYQVEQKTYAVEAPLPLKPIDDDVLLHLDESRVFKSVAAFEHYYHSLDTVSPDGPVIALLTSVPGPFNANRDHLDAMIKAFELAGFRVYTVASMKNRLQLLQQIKPDAVVLMPHGRLHLGDGAETVAWFRQQNIPLFTPLSVFQDYQQWIRDKQGFEGGMLTMNVVLPEVDGGIVPYVINAQFADKDGYRIFRAIPARLANFTRLIKQWVALKLTPRKDKKLAIVYFRGPGLNAMVAGNMAVAESLFNTLHKLKAAGYDLGDLPNDFSAFKARLDKQGLVMVPYAKGLMATFMEQGKPALIPADIYTHWCESRLAIGLCEKMNALYGESPGRFMTTEVEGKTHLAVARVQFGQVVLLPQPLPGLGDDTFQLVHGTDKAPPHHYAASYLWLREVFKADAIIHFGTHGSLEFTPAKQVALSDNDWSDALLGAMPHFYLYTMSNVGEAIIAKRRSYATIISHLTPPFMPGKPYLDMKRLADKLEDYASTEGAVQSQTRRDINALIIKTDVDQDLDLRLFDEGQGDDTDQKLSLLNSMESTIWQEQIQTPVMRWLETLANEKVNQGLYTLGHPYTPEQVTQTAQLMAIDVIAQAWFELQRALGQVAAVDEMPKAYRKTAQHWLQQLDQGKSAQDLIASLLTDRIQMRVADYKAQHPAIDEMAVIRGFIDLAKAGKNASIAVQQSNFIEADTDALKQLTATLIADEDSRQFLLTLKGDERFRHVSRSLDPAMREKAKLLARVIPAMADALKQMESPDMQQLIRAMQHVPVRKQVLDWLDNDNLMAEVTLAKQARYDARLIQLKDSLPTVVAILETKVAVSDWQQLARDKQTLIDFQQRYLSDKDGSNPFAEPIAAYYAKGITQLSERLAHYIEQLQQQYGQLLQTEKRLTDAVDHLQHALLHYQTTQEQLLAGPDNEWSALLTALDGGYVSPSTGGDPVLNPAALPTGRNMYAIDAEKTPSQAAWKVGQQLANQLLKSHFDKHGHYPKKVSFTLWPSEFIHTQGATLAQIFALLGVEPVRDAFGRVQNLRLLTDNELTHPRIDVVLQTAGQFRDLAASRLELIERAVVMAAKADKGAWPNHVATGVADAEAYLLAQGLAPAKARKLASRRSFGGLNGAYGTAIMGKVESSGDWQSDAEIARQYLNNMGARYGAGDHWGAFDQHAFAAALLNTEVVVQPRSSNTWGALSLDHVYEFMGGLNLAVRHVTGHDPDAYFNDYRNPSIASLQTLKQAIWSEMRTTLLNPAYLQAMREGGASSAESFAETLRNTFGWNLMKPTAIDKRLWDGIYDNLITDEQGIGMQAFFAEQNPYAFQEVTGVMLEAVRKDFWQASPEQVAILAQRHADMVIAAGPGCGSFTCGNAALQAFIQSQLNAERQSDYQTAMDKAQTGPVNTSAIVMTKDVIKTIQPIASDQSVTATEAQTGPNTEGLSQLPKLLLGLLLMMLIVIGMYRLYRRQ